MTHDFKPGDKVRHRRYPEIVYTVHDCDAGTWRALGSAWQSVASYELVEPSVTHRELREVLEELTKTTLQNDFNAGWNDALDAFFTQATGEQP